MFSLLSSSLTLGVFLNKLKTSSKLIWRRDGGYICPDPDNTFVTELNIDSIKYVINFAQYPEGIKNEAFLLFVGMKKSWFSMAHCTTIKIPRSKEEYREAQELLNKLNETVPIISSRFDIFKTLFSAL